MISFHSAPRPTGKHLKKIFGLIFCFLGFFFSLVGFLFAFLFELPGFFIMAGFGIFFIILGIIFLITTKDVSFFEMQRDLLQGLVKDRRCVACGRTIPTDANLCPYCGHKFEQQPTQKLKACQGCGAQLTEDVKFCSYCGFENK
jgi:RNA polymerase subunit RPABC4/transcription elongation factor Spt4